MTIPFKVPPPARLPLDLQELGPALQSPKSLGQNSESAEDEATLLWKQSGSSGLVLGGFATPKAKSFALEVQARDEDSTVIKKTNLADPRLLRSDRPPARNARAPVRPAESALIPRAALALLAPPLPKQQTLAPARLPVPPARPAVPAAAITRDARVEPAAVEAPILSVPSDWEETPYPYLPPLAVPLRAGGPKALWATVVGLAAVAAAITVVSHPEQSAVFVERVVASGEALVASIR